MMDEKQDRLQFLNEFEITLINPYSRKTKVYRYSCVEWRQAMSYYSKVLQSMPSNYTYGLYSIQRVCK